MPFSTGRYPSAPGFLPKTCRRGRPRSWPSQPEWMAGKGRRRASWEASRSVLTAALYGIPRNSHRFLAGTGDADPCQTCKGATEALGGGALLSFSSPLFFLSLMALVALSHLSSLPRRIVLPPPLLAHSLPHSLLLSLTLPSSLPPPIRSNVVTNSMDEKERGGRWVFSPFIFPPSLPQLPSP